MQKNEQNIQVEAKQPSATITQQQEILNVAESYIAAGFALVPIPYGEKGPIHCGWNMRPNTITARDQIERLKGKNIGLAHAYSGTCAIDIDDYIKAEEYLQQRGIDLTALMTADDAVQIQSGRENRAKLLYRNNEILPTFKIGDPATIIEFRCGTANGLTVQDVLPPSIHPDTGKPYVWIGDPHNIPSVPNKILTLWQNQTSTKNSISPASTKKTHRSNGNTHRRNITSMVVSPEIPEIKNIANKRQVRMLFATESVQKRLLDYLGFTDYDTLFQNGCASVRSPVPPYDEHKSGGLILALNGDVLFHDFSGECGSRHVPLQVLHARLVAGRYVNLTPTEKDSKSYGEVTLAVWATRLLIDAGVVEAAKVALPPCPQGTRPAVRKYYAGVKLLFRVRWAYKEHYGNPVPMGRKFMADWCGLTEQQARDAITDLLCAGVIHTADEHGRTHLFAPGPGYNSNT